MKAYGRRVTAKNDSGEAFGRWLAKGIDAFESARVQRARRRDPFEAAEQRRALAIQQRNQIQVANANALDSYQRRLGRLRNRASSGIYLAAGSAGLGVIDVATLAVEPGGVIPGSAGLWFVAAAAAALIGLRARQQLQTVEPPPPQALPTVPPPLLMPGSVGSEEAADLAAAEAQLYAMIPAVDELHAEAGLGLRATVASVQPNMYRLIERIHLVSQVDAFAAPQAADAAEVLRRRLADGVRAYQQLIAATATLLAAPDPAGPAGRTLAAATAELEAYAAGLGTASDVFDGN